MIGSECQHVRGRDVEYIIQSNQQKESIELKTHQYLRCAPLMYLLRSWWCSFGGKERGTDVSISLACVPEGSCLEVREGGVPFLGREGGVSFLGPAGSVSLLCPEG